MAWKRWVVPMVGVGLLTPNGLAQTTSIDRDSVIRGNAALAVDLYRDLASGEGNLFLSPFSISTALAMTYAGARGPTATELQKALHFPLPPDRLGPAYQPLLEQSKKTAGDAVRVANALWAQAGAEPLDTYRASVARDYGGQFMTLDFAASTEAARQTINDWVQKETRDKIKDLFPSGTIEPETRLVLTNAIYFKADWTHKFEKTATRDEPFRTGSQVRQVPMMHQTSSFGYADAGSYQVLELPYAGDQLSMVVFLPKENDGLAEFEKSLDVEKLTSAIRKLPKQEVVVTLPRFTMTSAFRLDTSLQKLGMRAAFNCQIADFSGMTGKRDLCIGVVVHKAFIEVNEAGTEAAGATGIGMRQTSIAARETSFKADHPFLFVIRDMLNDHVLFMGRVLRPAAS